MSAEVVLVERPQRWDHPMDPNLSASAVNWLMKLPPFCEMEASRFSAFTPLSDILQNDCRLIELRQGDILFQEGQYGDSAFLVLSGEICVVLDRLLTAEEIRRRRKHRQHRSSWLQWLGISKKRTEQANDRRSRTRTRSTPRNTSSPGGQERPVDIRIRSERGSSRIFLQDIPGVLATHQTSLVRGGELFGEMAAVTRTPREYTAAAATESLVLEIRWQGLKLLKQDPAFRQLLDDRYRSSALRSHLKETELFRFCPEENLNRIVADTRLEQFGELEWFAKYRQHSELLPGQRIAGEPLVAEEGQYAAGLWIIRGGFARLSRRQGAGHRTLAYLGKGQVFGLQELVHNARLSPGSPPLPYQNSLRAVGYVDVLRIPKQTVVEHLLPFVRNTDLPPLIESPRYEFGQPVLDAPLGGNDHHIETGLLEFLVDQRLMNGRQAMVIDMQRCTRCDDCVRACASTHGGEPVFVRQGPQYGPWMFAHACMHCEDPVCMIGCPTGAIHRDTQSGLVQIKESICIGCKTCAESCPYDNIRMVASRDHHGRARVDQSSGRPILKASKCDLCVEVSGEPSCQTACPHDALVRLDLSNLESFSEHLDRRAG